MTSVGATGNRNIDALLSGYRWTGAITYSFPDSRSDYESSYTEASATGFGSVSFNQMQAARFILEGTSAYSGGPRMGLTAFEQFTSASISDAGFNGADIRIAKSSSANPTAYAYYPVGDYRAGDIWFGTQYDYGNPQLGSYAYATMVHELGHALGLKHAHETGGVSNVSMASDRDSLEFSVMTYRSYIGQTPNGYTNETYGFPQTFMMYDIAALQHMYGANFNTNSGNTIYRWDATTGQAFVNGVSQGAPGANRVFLTIWDGGGTDTYDFSNYSTNLQVDLSPGGWSLISDVQRANLGGGNYARGNVFNALQYQGDARSLIEGAIGGSGNDTILGNAANNSLSGRWGNDVLKSLDGNDRLNGGPGQDSLYGGKGSDIFYLDSKSEANDIIFDFERGLDQVHLSSTGFGLTEVGPLSSVGVEFLVGTVAASSAPTLLYDSSQRGLYWDPDGAGLAGKSLLLTFLSDAPNQPPSAAVSSLMTVGSGWQVAGLGDLNGNGTEDVLWRNTSTGETAAWMMNFAQPEPLLISSGDLLFA